MLTSRFNGKSSRAVAHSRKRRPESQRKKQRPLHVEQLETRLLLAGDLDPLGAPPAVPELSSRPGAAVTLFLDFDGHVEAQWGAWSNVVSPVYDRDGDPTTFSASELTNITDIWARVAEDYAPFNVNVTTVEPATLGNSQGVRVVIGGSYTDWYGVQAGGVSFLGGFASEASNVAYVFENDLGNGFPRWIAETASHEAGHTFGLEHQSTWLGDALQEEHSTGSGDWAPIMGNGNFAQRTTWHNGTTHVSPNTFQDDIAFLTSLLGYVGDDFGNSTSDAALLPVSGDSASVSGLIGHNGDVDAFRFTTAGGDLSFTLAVARVGANLDSAIELWDANGQVLLVAGDSASFGATLQTTVASGTYFIVVRSSGGYGNIGEYTLSGTLVPGVAAQPKMKVMLDGVELPSGVILDFGFTPVGSPVQRTITIRNDGDADLQLDPISIDSCPPGCTLVVNVEQLLLAPGESTTFTLQLDASSPGTVSGTIEIVSNDGELATFDLAVNGTIVDPPPPPEPVIKTIDNGDDGFHKSGKWHQQKNKRGFERDIQFANKFPTHKYGKPKQQKHLAVATWTFTDLEPGEYRVSVTFPTSPSYASNAPFTILSDGQTLDEVLVNQKRKPKGLRWCGQKWEDLGTFTITGAQLEVMLSNRANGKVVADAIRIERVFSTANAALPEAATVLTLSSGDSLGLPAVVWSAAVEDDVGSHVTSTLNNDRLADYWHALAHAVQAPSPASPVEQLLRQHDDLLPELSLLGEVDSLVDEMALELALQASDD